MSKNKINGKKVQRNYFLIALLLGLIMVSILGRAVVTSIGEREKWIEMGERYTPFSDTIPAIRGKILSSDGQLLAASETYYQLYIDYWAEGMNENVLKANSRQLSVELNRLFPERSAIQYETNILDGLKLKQKEAAKINKNEKITTKSRCYPLSIRPVSGAEFDSIQKLPFFNQGRNKSGLYGRALTKRIKPFKLLASRTIGDIGNGMDTIGGKYGLEKAYDSELSGKPGISIKRWVEGRFKEVPDVEPVQGKDIVATIDIGFQEIVEDALMDKLKELNAESGTAVVMDVQTGEIKAIANLRQSKDGSWNEYLNYALSDMSEPGSTFKVASMMVALEDGIVHPKDPLNVGNGKFLFAGSLLLDHNANRGGYGLISAEKAIWFSSNVGVAKIILSGYEKNPGKFVEGLYRIGFNKDFNIEPLEHPDQERARIRSPKDNPKRWYKTTLPWMSFGYETQIPPIYTLTFFNAIANNGIMVKPMFVKEIRSSKKIEEKKTEIINKRICSDNTLKAIHAMLDSVVNHPGGTGKAAHSDLVRIAGKTGTAQLSQGAVGYKEGGTTYQVSFCGYFPANEPKYSCIVVIRRPLAAGASGGAMCGPVFKRIAETISARDNTVKPITLSEERLSAEAPKVKNGPIDQSKYVLDKLNIRSSNILRDEASTQEDSGRALLASSSVPNVVGMGAKDAVYALENTGLQVNLQGRGEVYSQSINAGEAILRGQTITIQLR